MTWMTIFVIVLVNIQDKLCGQLCGQKFNKKKKKAVRIGWKLD